MADETGIQYSVDCHNSVFLRCSYNTLEGHIAKSYCALEETNDGGWKTGIPIARSHSSLD